MNWIDGVLISLLLTSVIVGARKGLIRELMAFLVFFVAIIISVNYLDRFAVWVYDKSGFTPLLSAFISFILLLAISYIAFKVVGLAFYKIADIKSSGKTDQMGGALVGFLRGWVAIGFLTVLVFMLPMPNAFYSSFENSFLGPSVAKTIPLLYDSTAKIHPRNPSFMAQMEKSLLIETPGGQPSEDRQQVQQVMYQMERFFNSDFKRH